MRFFLLTLPALFFLSGCGGATADKAARPKATVVPDDAAALEALSSAKLNKNAQGLVSEVDFRGASVDADMLSNLAKLKGVRSVLLNGVDVKNADIDIIGQLTTVTNLDLRGCSVSEEMLEKLSGMKQLKALRLTVPDVQSAVYDDGLKHLAGLENLKVLVLDGAWVSDDGLAHLPKASIQELYLKATSIGDDGWKQFPNLRKLRVAQTQIGDVGLENLKAIKSLEELDVSETSLITDAGLAHIGAMKNLRKLNLWKVPVTDAGVAHLATLKKLKWLNLDQTFVTDDGLKHLTGMTELEFLHLGSTPVTDEGLPQLESLKALKDLKVTRTGATGAGVAKLSKKLPNTKIQLKYIEGQ